jgi:hypothetical protein
VTSTSATARSTGSLVGEYRSLSLGYRVVAGDPALGRRFADLYAGSALTPDARAPLPTLELSAAAGSFAVRLDEDRPRYAPDRESALVLSMAVIDEATVAASQDDMLILHASAVLSAHGPILFLGPSGAGKSTLAAAFTATGCTYLGDEAIGVAGDTTRLLANPKPFKLDAASRQALAHSCVPLAPAEPTVSPEVLVAPGVLGPVAEPAWTDPPAAIVQVRHVPGSPPRCSPVPRPDVARAIAEQCFNFARWGPDGLDLAVALARRAPGIALEFVSLEAAVTALERALC